MAHHKDKSAMERTDIKREDHMSAVDQADGTAGSEGIDEPSSDRTNRMSGNSRQQGREATDNAAGAFSGQGGQSGNTSDREGTGYTGGSTTSRSDKENPLV